VTSLVVDFDELPYMFKYSDKDEQKIVHIVNLVEEYRLTASKDSFWEARKMGYDPNDDLANKFRWEIADNMEWTQFICKTGRGLTKAGMARINESILTYIYCILGSQFNNRLLIAGQIRRDPERIQEITKL